MPRVTYVIIGTDFGCIRVFIIIGLSKVNTSPYKCAEAEMRPFSCYYSIGVNPHRSASCHLSLSLRLWARTMRSHYVLFVHLPTFCPPIPVGF